MLLGLAQTGIILLQKLSKSKTKRQKRWQREESPWRSIEIFGKLTEKNTSCFTRREHPARKRQGRFPQGSGRRNAGLKRDKRFPVPPSARAAAAEPGCWEVGLRHAEFSLFCCTTCPFCSDGSIQYATNVPAGNGGTPETVLQTGKSRFLWSYCWSARTPHVELEPQDFPGHTVEATEVPMSSLIRVRPH